MRRLILTIGLILLPLMVFAAEPVFLTGMLIQPSPTSTRITFILTHKTFGRVKYIPDPDRVIVEFENTKKNFSIENARLGGSNVKSITARISDRGVLEFILYVNGKVHATTRFLPSEENAGARLQLDITSVVKPPPKAAPVPVKPKNDQPAKINFTFEREKILPSPMAKPAAKMKRVFSVVIDAGHGGKDPGAKGVKGVEEKDVVLAIAKKLAHEINQQPNMRAILTRHSDYFVPLGQRLRLARKGEADLFIAIHADAYFNNSATGASVYTLSQRGASSVAARWLAQRENHSELDGVELNTLQDQSPMLRSVLIDLAQAATTQDSIRLGASVLNALENVSSLHYSHVERAPFLVLKSPDIPSVLVETGFLSNPKEEQRLADPKYQLKIARALREGIVQYVRKYGMASE